MIIDEIIKEGSEFTLAECETGVRKCQADNLFDGFIAGAIFMYDKLNDYEWVKVSKRKPYIDPYEKDLNMDEDKNSHKISRTVLLKLTTFGDKIYFGHLYYNYKGDLHWCITNNGVWIQVPINDNDQWKNLI